jgi:hypothetical protein
LQMLADYELILLEAHENVVVPGRLPHSVAGRSSVG